MRITPSQNAGVVPDIDVVWQRIRPTPRLDPLIFPFGRKDGKSKRMPLNTDTSHSGVSPASSAILQSLTTSRTHADENTRRAARGSAQAGRSDKTVPAKTPTEDAICLLDPGWKFNDRPGPAESMDRTRRKHRSVSSRPISRPTVGTVAR